MGRRRQPRDEEALNYLDQVIHTAYGSHAGTPRTGRRLSTRFQANSGRRNSSIGYSGGRRRSSVWRQLQRRNIEDDASVRVYELPPPTVSQRRRSSAAATSRKRSPLHADLYREEGGEDFDAQELTQEELYELLQQHNQNISGTNTIRLPSDILYRRKSRFDADDLLHPSGEGDDRRGTNLYTAVSFTDLAIAAAHERGEDDRLAKTVSKAQNKVRDFLQDTSLLRHTLSKIQGRYGSAIMEYFSFVKWLFLLNCFITLMTLPIIVPNFIQQSDITIEENSTWQKEAVTCTEKYDSYKKKVSAASTVPTQILDILQGSGFLEDTFLFHGHYKNMTYRSAIEGVDTTYNMGLAFLCVTAAIFIISFIVILYQLADFLKSAMINTDSGEFKGKFSVGVLSGWDYGLAERGALKLKRELIRTELQQLLSDQDYEKKISSRTTRQTVGLYIIRAIVNLLTVGILIGVVVAIFFAQEFADSKLAEGVSNLGALQFVYEYLATAIITVSYIIVPTIFNLLVKLEQYRPTVVINITMIRILVLRLFSLFFLLITTLLKLECFGKSCDTKHEDCGNVLFTKGSSSLNKCWETFIGQQIYKLVLLDFLVMLIVTFMVEYPRGFIFRKLKDRFGLIRNFGQQEFDMPKNVMDVLYNQALCWIGVFFSPFIPLFITLKLFLFFWIKRATLFKNQKPSPTLSKSSDVYSFFLWVMLISLVLAYVVLITYIQFVTPSQSCGPFKVHASDNFKIMSSIGLAVDNTLSDGGWTGDLKTIVKFIPTIPTALGALLLLSVSWYYFVTKNHGMAAEIKLYHDQLTKNVKDKQFMMRRVNNALTEVNQLASAKPSTASRTQNSQSRDTYNDQSPPDSPRISPQQIRTEQSSAKQARIPQKYHSSSDALHSDIPISQHEQRIERIPRKADVSTTQPQRASLQQPNNARTVYIELTPQRPHTTGDVTEETQQRHDKVQPSQNQPQGGWILQKQAWDSKQRRQVRGRKGMDYEEEESEHGYSTRASAGYNGDDDEDDSGSLSDLELNASIHRRPNPQQGFTEMSDISSDLQNHRSVNQSKRMQRKQHSNSKVPEGRSIDQGRVSVSFHDPHRYSSSNESDQEEIQTRIPRKYPSDLDINQNSNPRRITDRKGDEQSIPVFYQDNQAFEPEPDY